MKNPKDNSSDSNYQDKTTDSGSSKLPMKTESKPIKEKLVFPVRANGSQHFSGQPNGVIQFSNNTVSSDGE